MGVVPLCSGPPLVYSNKGEARGGFGHKQLGQGHSIV